MKLLDIDPRLVLSAGVVVIALFLVARLDWGGGESAQDVAEAVASLDGSNATRASDLANLEIAFRVYNREHGGYPATNGRLQTLCTYDGIDAGCNLKQLLPQLPVDPLGPQAGYWYVSDGKSFSVIARWEGTDSIPAAFRCPSRVLLPTQASQFICRG